MTLSLTPRFAAALSTAPQPLDAVDEVCGQALSELGGSPDLAFVFFSPHHRSASDEIARRLVQRLDSDRLAGCTGESILSGAMEIEETPALALWLAQLPQTTVELFHLTYERTPDGGGFLGWPERLSGLWPEGAALLVLADPFTFPADVLLERMNEDRPSAPVSGGMASGGSVPGENRLLVGDQAWLQGAAAVWIHGQIPLRTLVSQGCRPIGAPYVITQAEGNQIQRLGGKPAYKELQRLFREQPNREQALMQRGLHLGRVVNEYQEIFQAGDFLVRNVLGVNAEDQAVVVGDFFRPGQTVQFHVRDAETADLELRQLLGRLRRSTTPQGALLFTCNGRGVRLFQRPHHDAQAVQDALGPLPLAGFFAQGEIGPIGGHNFLHGFTASLAMFG